MECGPLWIFRDLSIDFFPQGEGAGATAVGPGCLPCWSSAHSVLCAAISSLVKALLRVCDAALSARPLCSRRSAAGVPAERIGVVVNVVAVAVGGDRVRSVVPCGRPVGIVGREGAERRVDDLRWIELGGAPCEDRISVGRRYDQ